jgi:hypothetical protein
MPLEESELRRLYHDEGMTQAEIGEKCDVVSKTVARWMADAGVETRSPKEAARNQYGHPSLHVSSDGYEMFNVDGSHFFHHRLLAVCEFGFDAVVGKDVHHQNELPWDNRPSNIKLMGEGEHRAHHQKKTTFTDELLMMELYHNEDLPQTEISNVLGIAQSSVSHYVGGAN